MAFPIKVLRPPEPQPEQKKEEQQQQQQQQEEEAPAEEGKTAEPTIAQEDVSSEEQVPDEQKIDEGKPTKEATDEGEQKVALDGDGPKDKPAKDMDGDMPKVAQTAKKKAPALKESRTTAKPPGKRRKVSPPSSRGPSPKPEISSAAIAAQRQATVAAALSALSTPSSAAAAVAAAAGSFGGGLAGSGLASAAAGGSSCSVPAPTSATGRGNPGSSALALTASSLPGLQSLLLALATSSGGSSKNTGKKSGGGGGGGAGSGGASGDTGDGSSDTSKSVTASGLPTAESVRVAALKTASSDPPFVHLSSRDSAPQLRIDDGPPPHGGRRLTLRGGMRGYRMSRASHGAQRGCFYYEVNVLEPPCAREIVESLPGNVRLGERLRRELEEELVREEAEKRKGGALVDLGEDDALAETHTSKRRKVMPVTPSSGASGNGTGIASGRGHLRLGWSMRTGDLQAPVGYDRWSYGIRDIGGSRVHNSRREDRWGGEGFVPGDIVGLCVCLVGDNATDLLGTAASYKGGKTPPPTNHIRFYKNGKPLGQFVVSRGTRLGGEAFDKITPGLYYPAISSYMGGTCRVNFGPHFVFPPKSLPGGIRVHPVSSLCPPPPTPAEAEELACREQKAFAGLQRGGWRGGSSLVDGEESAAKAFREAVVAEAEVRHDVYSKHMTRHVEEVREARKARNLSIADLPPPEAVPDTMFTIKVTENTAGDGRGVDEMKVSEAAQD